MADYFEVDANNVAIGAMITLPDDADLADCFPADRVASFKPATPDMKPGWVWDGQAFEPPTSPSKTPSKSDLLSRAASVRYTKEIGGISIGGVKVATDEASQAKITGAYVKAARDDTFATQWKGSDGAFTALDAKTILALGDAVAAHVAGCFAKEAAVSADIGSGKVTTFEGVNAAFETR